MAIMLYLELIAIIAIIILGQIIEKPKHVIIGLLIYLVVKLPTAASCGASKLKSL